MNKVSFIEIEINGKMLEHAVIDHGNEEFTSMLKSTYDEQVKQATKPTIDEPTPKS